MSDQKRTLVLLRHAKSAYPAGVADPLRPLAPRGLREAGLAGDWLRSPASASPPIQAVLCSTATRTRQTLERTGLSAPVEFVDGLYGASPGSVIAEINRVDEERFGFDAGTLLVIGHEPAISTVALRLAGAPGTSPAAVDRITAKYPTSAMAVLRFTGPWSALSAGTAALVSFHVPR
ncbi:SixA phosphatase family protein [Mycolicibacterium fallax]|uniref:Phosphohistidine phosphatase n=1 Tax=Mycolicibacterium fallax TaxID=1793 RepID=A0A1X1R7U5_MYCFA|nr:histidine phosphatase family protein [Mycolicibacterium fallax]ORV00929.1 hypothetical protein AWC04_14730 [Mycolicibacterium fallax]HOW95286.1 histidine phosphatase family protein [Mycolicibacterium fallax]